MGRSGWSFISRVMKALGFDPKIGPRMSEVVWSLSIYPAARAPYIAFQQTVYDAHINTSAIVTTFQR